MPTDLPRRQTTSQFRPVLASRSKATRNRAGSMLGSSIVILAPVEERSCTTHWRAPKPPSKVIQPRWCSDLRASRFVVIAAIHLLHYAPSLPYPDLTPGRGLRDSRRLVA